MGNLIIRFLDAAQKPGFLLKYFVAVHKFDKNPVSLSESKSLVLQICAMF